MTEDAASAPELPDGEALQAGVEELLLGGQRKYSRAEVAAKAGMAPERSRMLWQALGFAKVGDDVAMFTDGDAEALRLTNELITAGILEPDQATATARMLGQHLSRLAEWQVVVVRDLLVANPELAADERQLMRLLQRLVPDMEQLLTFAWRRHLTAYASRLFRSAPEEVDARPQVVGFADMVGFTTLTRRSNEADLINVVDRFDALTADIVAENHGQIVKMLGDEVLFVADSPGDGAQIALRLLEAADADPDLPSLRAGLAYGRVLSRFGDVYGSVVNIAARLTSIARPGTALIDRELSDVLSDDPRFVTRTRRPVSVRGYQRLRPSVLRRAGEDPPTLVEAAQQRAAELLGLSDNDDLSDVDATKAIEAAPHIPLRPDEDRDERRHHRRRRR